MKINICLIVKKIKQQKESINMLLNISHKEFFDVLFNRRVMRHRIKKNQIKFHRIGTYEVYEISLSCFDNKIHIR